MKTQTFEKWLEEDKWEPEGVLDDDMPDAFEAWLAELDTQEVMDFAEEWGEKRFLDGKEFVLKAFEPHIRALDTEAFATHIDNDALKGGADYPPVNDNHIAGVDFSEPIDILENIITKQELKANEK